VIVVAPHSLTCTLVLGFILLVNVCVSPYQNVDTIKEGSEYMELQKQT